MDDLRAYVFEFGEYRVDVARQVLTRNGQAVPLTPRVFATLLCLVRHYGKVVGKDELMRTVWPDTFVEENNLNQNVSTLRRVLGEVRGENRYILTVPGQGYQFVAMVRPVTSTPPTRATALVSPDKPGVEGPSTERGEGVAAQFTPLALRPRVLAVLAVDKYVPPQYHALVQLGLGDSARALQWLECAYDERDVHMVFLGVDPKWDILRSDPRFIRLLNRLHLQPGAH